MREVRNHARWRLRAIVLALEVIALAALAGTYSLARAQDDTSVEFISPIDEAVLTGVVEIRGNLKTASFLAADLAFAYADGPADQWFGIADVSQPAADAQLAVWDTTAISDGPYLLRIRMKGTDGTVHDAVIRVQVRNYTSAPTPTDAMTPTNQPLLQVATPVVLPETPTMVRPPAETPSPLPPNPAGITHGDVMTGFARGGFAVLAIFLLWGAVVLRRRV